MSRVYARERRGQRNLESRFGCGVCLYDCGFSPLVCAPKRERDIYMSRRVLAVMAE